MKANELMVGDIILYEYDKKRFPARVEEIYLDSALVEEVNGEYEPIEIEENELFPIPLTSEILEKNGFHERSTGVFVCEKFNELSDYDWFSVYRMINGKTYLEINSFAPGLGCFTKAGVKHLHELQRALRLCGIEKTIEI